jgi:hypothetical protein
MTHIKHPLANEVLKLRGKKSMGLIARQFGVTRNVVAGIFFRAAHPGERQLGTGYRTGQAAPEVSRRGGKVGRECKHFIRAALEEIERLCKSELPSDFARTLILEIAEEALDYAEHKKQYQKGRREAARTAAEQAA